MSLLRWTCVLALAGALAGCGDDGSSEGEDLPMPVAEEVSADEGADIETQGAAISIPAGALAEDTEVTVEVILPTGQPDADKLASLIYDFGPDGTTFEMPVELTIEFSKNVPEGMEATMAWLDEDTDTWVPLSDSRVEDDAVIATTDHFTMFAIILTPGGQLAGGCEDFADFEACGGDITGSWTFALACADLELADILGEDNALAMCDGVQLTANIDISGSVTFEENSDYSSEMTREVDFAISLPVSCLPDGATCSALDNMEPGTEVSEVDGACELSTMLEPQMETETGTYELEADTLIMIDADSTEPDEPQEYCVEGDTLTVRFVEINDEGVETVTFIQATRE